MRYSTVEGLACWSVISLALGGCSGHESRQKTSVTHAAAPLAPSALPQFQREAAAMSPLVISKVGREFLQAVDTLPRVSPRLLYRNAAKREWLTPREYEERTPEAREGFATFDVSEEFYYTTKYGTPVAYARALDVLGQTGLDSVSGRKVLDFGYGGIGQLRILAAMGAEAVGVDVDPLLVSLYSSPADQGPIVAGRSRGSVRLVHGRWPAEEAAKDAVGGSYDLIISKNTLKNGYLHPAEPVEKRMLVDLGVDDESFVRALYATLKPGGRVLIYNLCPAPAPPGKPYIPWADGRCPFPKPMWESAGFRVLAFDAKDDQAARLMGRALAWDQGESPMDLENDLFAWYTLLEKR